MPFKLDFLLMFLYLKNLNTHEIWCNKTSRKSLQLMAKKLVTFPFLICSWCLQPAVRRKKSQNIVRIYWWPYLSYFTLHIRTLVLPDFKPITGILRFIVTPRLTAKWGRYLTSLSLSKTLGTSFLNWFTDPDRYKGTMTWN